MKEQDYDNTLDYIQSTSQIILHARELRTLMSLKYQQLLFPKCTATIIKGKSRVLSEINCHESMLNVVAQVCLNQ